MRVKNHKLKELIKEEVQNTLKEVGDGPLDRGSQFKDMRSTIYWAEESAEFLRQLSLHISGKQGRVINAIAEKLEDAVNAGYDHGREDEADAWRAER